MCVCACYYMYTSLSLSLSLPVFMFQVLCLPLLPYPWSWYPSNPFCWQHNMQCVHGIPPPPCPLWCGLGWRGVAYVVWEYKIAGTSQYFTWGQPENEPQLIGSQVSHGRLGWHTSDTSVVAITARPQRGIDLMPCEAIVARLLAAPGAGWHTAKLVFALDLRSRHPPEPEKNQPNLPENDSPVVVGFVP